MHEHQKKPAVQELVSCIPEVCTEETGLGSFDRIDLRVFDGENCEKMYDQGRGM